jgi:hypothetical protein
MRATLAYICASAAAVGAFEALPSTFETGADVEEDEEEIGAEEEAEDAGTDVAAVLRGCCDCGCCCCCLAAAVAFGTSSPVVSVDLRTLPTEALAAEDEDEEEEEEEEAAAEERPEAGAVEGRAECGARADGAADEAADDDADDAASLAASVSSITRSKFVFHTIASSSHPPDAKKSPAGEKRAHSVDDWWPWIV